jgi:hypothetical protein
VQSWRLSGEEVGGCNCAWGCPCQFNAPPTLGRCEGLTAWQVTEGHFGSLRLDGVRFAGFYGWPGAIHEANGTQRLVIDDRTSPEQRAALEALHKGGEGGAVFEIFAAVCPNRLETVVAPIELTLDRAARLASVRIPGLAELTVEPIRNPVTGDEHRARIVLPDGFEFEEAEVANAVSLRATAGDPLTFSLENTYGQLNAFDWSNA